MEHQNVRSSNIRSIAYEAEEQILQIRFHSGGLYNYFNVPESVYNALVGATSHGKFFASHIKERYRFRKVR